MSDIVGYSRLSSAPTRDEIEAQLRSAGATQVFWEQPAPSLSVLESVIASVSRGDTIVVVASDHLSPSVDHFIRTIGVFDDSGIRLRSLAEPALSTDSAPAPPGEVLRALVDLRRRLVAAQTATLTKATPAPRRPGRPSVMTEEKLAMALELRRQGRSIAQIARVIGVSASAVRRAIQLSRS